MVSYFLGVGKAGISLKAAVLYIHMPRSILGVHIYIYREREIYIYICI